MIATVRAVAAGLLFALLALSLAGCGGSSGKSPGTTPSPGATSEQLDPTTTGEPPDVSEPGATVVDCENPYPNQAPPAATPGEPLRLHPEGEPEALAPYAPLPLVADAQLEQVVQQALGGEAEHIAVVVRNLADGHGVAIDGNRTFYAASLFKIWLMLEAYHQVDQDVLSLDGAYVVSRYYQQSRLHPDDLAWCTQVTVRETLASMMSISDNVAANLLLDLVGPANANAMLRAMGLRVAGFFADDSLPATANGTALLLEAIARRQAVSVQASDAMLALLESEAYNDRIPALLPAGTRVAHKTGSWSNATHDAGIVFSPNATYVIVILSDVNFQDEGAAEPLARVSKAVYDYYNPAPV